MRPKHLFLLLLALPLIGLLAIRIQKRVSASHVPQEGKTFKVFEIVYNPVIESQGGQTLVELKGWNDPALLSSQFKNEVNLRSHSFVTYAVQTTPVDDIPQKKDGFDYSDETYLDCLADQSKCHQPDTVDYAKIFADFDICSKVVNEGVSEVWLWGGPWFGYWEYNVKGPVLNITPENIPQCGDKTVSVMGFSYERRLEQMLENFGHRVEGVLVREIAGGNWQQDEANEWNKFSLVASPVSSFPYGHCGNVHYPPNGVSDYDYANTRSVDSDCDDYQNYPNLTASFQSINCQRWGCSQYGYLTWWLERLPHAPGTTDGHLNHWWRYVVDYDTATAGRTVVQVVSGADDANSGCDFKPATNEVYVGTDENCTPSQPYTAGFRLTNVPISQGTPIEYAYLEFTVDGTYTNPLDVIIHGEAVDNAQPFSPSHQPKDLLPTANSTSWTINETWSFNTQRPSPDLTAILQEIVNRPGWQSGNAINLAISYVGGSGHRRVYAYERSPSQAAKLIFKTASEQPATMHVGDLDGTRSANRTYWTATVTATVHDAAMNPLPNATLSATWSAGYSGSASCTTDTSGKCSLTTGRIAKKKKNVTLTVDNLTHPQYLYDSSANHDPDGDSNGTTITLLKP